MVVILEGRNWLPRRGRRAAAARAVVVDAYPFMVGVVEAYARISAQRLVRHGLPRSGNTSAAVGRRARRERELQHPSTHRRNPTSTRPPTSHAQCGLVRRNSSVRRKGGGDPPHRPRGHTRRAAANCPLAHGEGRPPHPGGPPLAFRRCADCSRIPGANDVRQVVGVTAMSILAPLRPATVPLARVSAVAAWVGDEKEARFDSSGPKPAGSRSPASKRRSRPKRISAR